MEILESLAKFFGIILLIAFIISIRSCQCDMRAGDGLTSHYNPIIGCVFEQEKE